MVEDRYQEGRRVAKVKERAGKFAVTMYIEDDDSLENMGGSLEYSKSAAMMRVKTWLELGLLP